jgi:hypothetical protein
MSRSEQSHFRAIVVMLISDGDPIAAARLQDDGSNAPCATGEWKFHRSPESEHPISAHRTDSRRNT